MIAANAHQLDRIHSWLKRRMIDCGCGHYLAFAVGRHAYRVWAYTFSDDYIAFALVDKGNRIVMFDSDGSPEQVDHAMQHLLAEIHDEGHSVVIAEVEVDGACEVAFLEKYGFAKQPNSGLMVLDNRFGDVSEISNAGRKVAFSVKFYDEQYLDRLSGSPYASTEDIGVLTKLHELILPKRAIAFGDGDHCPTKTAIEIEVDGEFHYRGHMRSDDLFWMGAKREPSGIVYFDVIDLFTWKHLVKNNRSTWLDRVGDTPIVIAD